MRLSLKYKIVLKGIPSSGTGVDIEELQQEEAILGLKCKSCFVNRTITEDLADRTAQK